MEVPSRSWSGVVSLELIRARTDTELWPDTGHCPLSGVPPGLEGPGPDIRQCHIIIIMVTILPGVSRLLEPVTIFLWNLSAPEVETVRNLPSFFSPPYMGYSCLLEVITTKYFILNTS